GLAALASAHRATPQIGRTWLQHALPITFGLKAAGWLDAVERHRTRLDELRPRLLVLQFGGAAGTLASLGTRGLDVAAALGRGLGAAWSAPGRAGELGWRRRASGRPGGGRRAWWRRWGPRWGRSAGAGSATGRGGGGRGRSSGWWPRGRSVGRDRVCTPGPW